MLFNSSSSTFGDEINILKQSAFNVTYDIHGQPPPPPQDSHFLRLDGSSDLFLRLDGTDDSFLRLDQS